jgi:hypothetical protein
MNQEERLKSAYRDKTKNARALALYANSFGMDRADMNALSGKNILLVGGGMSPILTQLEENGIKPESVVNVDFSALRQDNPGQKLVREDFLKHEIGPDAYDEIWALYSLPHYTHSEIEVKKFYAKAILGLAPGGHLRVYPIAAALGTAVDKEKPLLDVNKIKEACVEFFQDLSNAFPDLNLSEIRSPRIFKSDSMSSPSMESYYTKLEQSQPNKPRLMGGHIGGASLNTISSAIFTAPADKAKLDSWLREYLRKLGVLLSKLALQEKNKKQAAEKRAQENGVFARGPRG